MTYYHSWQWNPLRSKKFSYCHSRMIIRHADLGWNWKFQLIQYSIQNLWHNSNSSIFAVRRECAHTISTNARTLRNSPIPKLTQMPGNSILSVEDRDRIHIQPGNWFAPCKRVPCQQIILVQPRGQTMGTIVNGKIILNMLVGNPRGKNWQGVGVKSQGCGCWQWKWVGWGLVCYSKPSDWNCSAVMRETGFSVTMIGANQTGGISWNICQWGWRVQVGFKPWDFVIA